MPMMSTSNVSTLAALVIATVAAVNGAHAATPYDGSWSVQIMTQRGSCDPSSSFGVEIQDGVVSGGAGIRGRVTGKGAVSVSVASGSSSANGSGRLTASSGGGSWRGVGSRGPCSGRWSASRR